MIRSLAASLGFAAAVHLPALLPVLGALVAAEAAYVVHRLFSRKASR